MFQMGIVQSKKSTNSKKNLVTVDQPILLLEFAVLCLEFSVLRFDNVEIARQLMTQRSQLL